MHPRENRRDGYHLTAILSVVLVGWVIYSGTLNVPFLFDDEPQITSNAAIRLTELDGESLLRAAFESPSPHRPVANLSFALNYYFGQYDVRGYHRVNLLIHIASGLFVYFLTFVTVTQPVVRATLPVIDQKKSAGQNQHFATSWWMAIFAALIFTAHPVQTQSVTYLVQRMSSLATLLYLAALLFYVLGRLSHSGRQRWWLWSGGLTAWILALGCKEIAVTLPLIVLIYEWFFFQDLSWVWLKRHLKYLVGVMAVVGLVALLYLGNNPLETINAGYAKRDFTAAGRILTQFRVVVFYLSLLLFPFPSRLNLLSQISTSQSLLSPLSTLVGFGLVVGLLGLGIYLARQHRLVAFCILWVSLNLVIESSLIPLEMIFEHRLYLPMFGFAVGVAYLLFALAAIKQNWSVIVLMGVSLLLAAATYERNKDWQDAITLWSDVIAKNPQATRAHTNRGLRYLNLGKQQQALDDFDRALALKSNSAQSYINRANANGQLGKYARAIEDCARAIGLQPDLKGVHYNRGNYYKQVGNFQRALDDYSREIEVQPDFAAVYNNRGNTYQQLGNHQRALADFTRAIELKPDYARAYQNRAALHAQLGKRESALRDQEQARKLRAAHRRQGR